MRVCVEKCGDVVLYFYRRKVSRLWILQCPDQDTAARYDRGVPVKLVFSTVACETPTSCLGSICKNTSANTTFLHCMFFIDAFSVKRLSH